jgi:hypothetical protein
MKVPSFIVFGIAALLSLCAVPAYSQQPPRPDHPTAKSHPWSLKTDLMGFRSHSLSLEGEVFLFWRISAFAQAGMVAGYRSTNWQSKGYLGRAGLKYYLGSKDAVRMTGFAVRCEAAYMGWRSSSRRNELNRNDAAGFVGLSYTWNPFRRLVVEPCLGVGKSQWHVGFDDPNLIGGPTGIPNTPWIGLGKQIDLPEYNADGDLIGMTGTALQLSVGLLVGIRF